jgi:hypothetical protein
VVQVGQLRRLLDLGARGVGLGQRDVLRDRGREQERLLRHPGDGRAQRRQPVVLDRLAAPADGPPSGT